jgi:hypothetical protein
LLNAHFLNESQGAGQRLSWLGKKVRWTFSSPPRSDVDVGHRGDDQENEKADHKRDRPSEALSQEPQQVHLLAPLWPMKGLIIFSFGSRLTQPATS